MKASDLSTYDTYIVNETFSTNVIRWDDEAEVNHLVTVPAGTLIEYQRGYKGKYYFVDNSDVINGEDLAEITGYDDYSDYGFVIKTADLDKVEIYDESLRKHQRYSLLHRQAELQKELTTVQNRLDVLQNFDTNEEALAHYINVYDGVVTGEVVKELMKKCGIV